MRCLGLNGATETSRHFSLMSRPNFLQPLAWTLGLGWWLASSLLAGNPGEMIEAISRMQPPLTVVGADLFKDGGTQYLEIRDRSSKTLVLCLDQRMMSPDSGCLFLYAQHPSSPEAQRVPTGPAEDAALRLLEQVRAGLSRAERARHAKHIDSMLAIARHQRQETANAAKKGPFPEAEVVKLAAATAVELGIETKPADRIETKESESTWEVRFVGLPYEEDGEAKLYDLVIRISKRTRHFVLSGCVNQRPAVQGSPKAP
jgi:hypothetical protein